MEFRIMEMHTTICDKCKKTIANFKCEICGKDLCGNCAKELNLLHIRIKVCGDCSRIKLPLDAEEFIKQTLIDNLKKAAVVGSLKDEENKIKRS
jgi:ribosome-binding protein aMBF1 (putative translation factor)